MKTPFWARVKDGKINIFGKREWKAFIGRSEGKEVEIWVEVISGKRTGQQNALWWPLIVRTISQHTGEEEWKIHRHLERELIPKDHLTIKGKTEEVQKTCSELSKSEFNGFIEACLRWAAEELNITIQLE